VVKWAIRKTKNNTISIASFSLESYQSLHLAKTDAIKNKHHFLTYDVKLFPELLKNTNIFTKSIL